MKSLFLFILSVMCYSFCYSNPINGSDNLEKNYYYASCNILNSKFEVVRVLSSSWLCLPLEDGGWIESNSRNFIARKDRLGTVVWKKSGYFHHQISETADNSIYVLQLVKQPALSKDKEYKADHVLYDIILEINILNGKVLNKYSLYDELKRNNNLKKILDRRPYAPDIAEYVSQFNTKHEKLHLNSVNPIENGILVNDLRLDSFILDKNFNFKTFLSFPKLFTENTNLKILTHDLQKLGEDHFIGLKNSFHDNASDEETFKIIEYKGDKIIFQFPINTDDFVASVCCGSVQKINDYYLVGFPIGKDPSSNKSFVALVSKDGKWIAKKWIDVRFQSIKLLTKENFLIKNKAK